MDRAEFESSLRADGFGAAEEKQGQPGFTTEPHTHPFAVRGLVLSGEFILERDGVARTHGAGETFSMDAHCEHAERFGATGASYLVGRKEAPVT